MSGTGPPDIGAGQLLAILRRVVETVHGVPVTSPRHDDLVADLAVRHGIVARLAADAGRLDLGPRLRDALREAGLVADDRLAIGGASMGAMTALGIMTHHPETRAVAALMGSGYFTSLSHTLFAPDAAGADAIRAALAPWDVSTQLARVADRPLLLWHGEDDDVVPAAQSLRLASALREHGLDANLTCVWEAGVKHRITPDALEATVAFFRRHV